MYTGKWTKVDDNNGTFKDGLWRIKGLTDGQYYEFTVYATVSVVTSREELPAPYQQNNLRLKMATYLFLRKHNPVDKSMCRKKSSV